jgi:hypothetical protein
MGKNKWFKDFADCRKAGLAPDNQDRIILPDIFSRNKAELLR